MANNNYPPAYSPGPQQHWAINEAWDVLDLLKPNQIGPDTRAFLAGAMTIALLKAYRAGLDARSEAIAARKAVERA